MKLHTIASFLLAFQAQQSPFAEAAIERTWCQWKTAGPVPGSGDNCSAADIAECKKTDCVWACNRGDWTTAARWRSNDNQCDCYCVQL
ncbi:hypothetical protein CTRI78_v004360 [Colletotrichum trifolii]|uniref:Secreted protein n=1 Tax=Colletotrichum trifolii TaxID=5466 RepID=A0A4R8RH99_COLTR|nr:hypothetical protein CTRI78_v004360 [Colletotrichum trifolii]